jgi:cell division protein FtsW
MWLQTKDKNIDQFFLIFVLFFLVFGLIILNSSSSALAYNKFGDVYYFVKRQLFSGILPGLIFFWIFSKIDYVHWLKWNKYFYFLVACLLVMVFIPGIGTTNNTVAHSWINFPFSFQPSELAKLVVALVLASMFSQQGRNIRDFQNGLLPIFFTLIPIFVLILVQPDIGTLSILCFMVFFVLILAGVEWKVIALLSLVGIIAFGFLMFDGHRRDRMSVFLHPEIDPQGIGYHVNAAYLAVGSGGIWGVGYGHSRQKHLYLPEVQADSVFAVFAEEFGFVISVGFVFLFFIFTLKGFQIANQAPDKFGYLLVSGIMVWFFIQASLNMLAMVGGAPITGLPLPLISHGGTAMVVNLAALGIVANVSRKRNYKN